MDYVEFFIAVGTLFLGLVAVFKFFLSPIDKKMDGIEKRIDRLEDHFKEEIKKIKSELKELKTHFDKRLDQIMAVPKS